MPLFYDTWPLPQGHQRLSPVPKIIETGEFVALGLLSVAGWRPHRNRENSDTDIVDLDT